MAWALAEATIAHGWVWRWVSSALITISDGVEVVDAWLVNRACAASDRARRLAVAARRRVERLRP